MPPWNHIHPALVHFPIALLTVAPLLVLLGLILPGQKKGLHTAAAMLLVLGVGGLFLALESGDAVTRYARATPDLMSGVRVHELLAQKTTLIFVLLGLFFLVLWGLPLVRRRELSRTLELGLLTLWLLLSAFCVLSLAQTGHAGGHLVHDLHTHAGPEPAAP